MICISISAKKIKEALQDISEANKIADVIEIRTDYISDLDLPRLLNSAKKPVIITHRKYDEGGFLQTHENERLEILKSAIKLRANFIDIEYSSGNEIINELKKLKRKTKIILSYHNFKETPTNLEEIYSKLNKIDCDIVKIVTYANSINDNLRIFEFLEGKKNLITFCMGEYGQLSRILALKYGSLLIYSSLSYGKESAEGQLTGEMLKEIYHVHKINKNTKIYGLLGNPIKESKGYIIHNNAFRKLGLNNVYVNFLVDDLEFFFKEFRGFFSGLSVTMPFKIDVMKYLDKIDNGAKKIRAVNTIVRNNNKLIGYNTDYIGAIKVIKEKTSIKNKKVLILGAGGVARAIVYGILMEECKVIVADINNAKSEYLANEFNCDSCKLTEINKIKPDILINATSVGMSPNIGDIPFSEDYLRKGMTVFDVVYSPIETKLIKTAREKGCKVILGIDMFIYQAVEQFRLWTTKNVNAELMRGSILENKD